MLLHSVLRGLVVRRLSAAALAWLGATGPAAGERIVLDYTSVGQFTQPFTYNNCGVAVRAYADATLGTSADLNVNAAFGGPGIAVEGGNHGAFDAGEALTFEFYDFAADEPVTATEISYVAEGAPGDTDGDAVPAELLIEAFGPGAASLGVEAFSGAGERSVSAAFAGAPIGRLVVTAVDAVRIEGIAYTPAPGISIRVEWPYGGAYEREQIGLCGVTLTGSSTLTVGGLGAPGGGGVGVQGGFGGGQPDSTIDSGETLEVALSEPAGGVSYH